MSDLFISLYLDEDVEVLVATLIRARGFVVTTTQEAGNVGADDGDQLDFTVQSERAFLAHNRTHFEHLAEAYFERGDRHHGIIIAMRRSPYEIAERVLQLLNSVTADEMVDQLRYL